jgi:prephenate dehydrogenase
MGTSRVALVGTGLIGGSVGLALRRHGIDVTGFERDAERLARAVERGAIDRGANDAARAFDGVDLAVIALPVSLIAAAAGRALEAGVPVVTDVGSVKTPIVRAIERDHPEFASRFVGGHPMAGSEQEGVDGADAELFSGATWVLTPTPRTDPDAFTAVRDFVDLLGAEVVAVPPTRHDELVAMVSHVPHLAATTLMQTAAGAGGEQAPLLRLAAGGFRDMTRIAAGHPAIWPDICVENGDAIVESLDRYVRELHRVRDLVVTQDRAGLLMFFEGARSSRRSLPASASLEGPLVELRIPVPDRPGVIAEVTTLAGRQGVNIADLEIAHSAEGERGVMVLVVAETGADAFVTALEGLGYRVARSSIA